MSRKVTNIPIDHFLVTMGSAFSFWLMGECENFPQKEAIDSVNHPQEVKT